MLVVRLPIPIMMLTRLLSLGMCGAETLILSKNLRWCRWTSEWLIVVRENYVFLSRCTLWCTILLRARAPFLKSIWCMQMCTLGPMKKPIVIAWPLPLSAGTGAILVKVQLTPLSIRATVLLAILSPCCEKTLLGRETMSRWRLLLGRTRPLEKWTLETAQTLFLCMPVETKTPWWLGSTDIRADLTLKLMQLWLRQKDRSCLRLLESPLCEHRLPCEH